MQRRHVFGVMLAFVLAGCAHYDSKGRAVRTGAARFDAQSVTAPGIAYTLESDGTWAGMDGDRYELVGDDLRKVGAFAPTPSLIRPSGWVTIDRRPDGLMYIPSYPGGRIWIFVTEDGDRIPAELEVPLYLATQLGLGGQWIDIRTPGSEDAGTPPVALRLRGPPGGWLRGEPGRGLRRSSLPGKADAGEDDQRAERDLGESRPPRAAVSRGLPRLGLSRASPLARRLADVQVVPR